MQRSELGSESRSGSGSGTSLRSRSRSRSVSGLGQFQRSRLDQCPLHLRMSGFRSVFGTGHVTPPSPFCSRGTQHDVTVSQLLVQACWGSAPPPYTSRPTSRLKDLYYRSRSRSWYSGQAHFESLVPNPTFTSRPTSSLKLLYYRSRSRSPLTGAVRRAGVARAVVTPRAASRVAAARRGALW